MRAAPSSETVAANCSDASVARATDAEEAMEEEIEAVDKEAMSGDYDHLLQTLMAHCE